MGYQPIGDGRKRMGIYLGDAPGTPYDDAKKSFLLEFWALNILREIEFKDLRKRYLENKDTVYRPYIVAEWNRRTLLRPAMPAADKTKPNELLRAG